MIDDSVKGFMPSKEHAKIMGFQYDEIFTYNKTYISPLFLKHFKNHYINISQEALVEELQFNFFELVAANKSTIMLINGDSQSVPSVVLHQNFWDKTWGIKSDNTKKIKHKVFPAEATNSVYGLQSAVLLSLKHNDLIDTEEYFYRNIVKYSFTNNLNKNYASLGVLLQALIDNKGLVNPLNANQISNLAYFYDALRLNNEALFTLWLSNEWEEYKTTFLMYTETLSPSVFANLVDADLHIKHWGDNINLPREWLLKLYQKPKITT
jgi:hypothetical protein